MSILSTLKKFMEKKETMTLEIYQEATPNPESLKFVTNLHLLPNYYAEFKSADACGESELAAKLFTVPFVQSVFISNNFLTITKKPDYDWYEITPELKEVIKQFVYSDRPIVSNALLEKGEAPKAQASDDPEAKIKELLDKYVKPAVEGDGGYIEFRSFTDGVVRLSLQGSCSGCPSASMTLKVGIEGLLKRMVPEVTEVIAVEE